MFLSNTATAAMMLTFLTPVLKALPADGKGKIALAMAIPIGANVGGLGTPIGTPPNALAHGTGMIEQKYMAKAGLTVGIIGLILGYGMLILLGNMGFFG